MSAPGPHANGHNALPPPKQIRFVSNDGQPHAKKRRINAACQTCRKKKTRCSGERPYCKTCVDNGHTCAGYADPALPRKSLIATRDEDEDTDSNSGSSSPTRQAGRTSPGTTRKFPRSTPPLQKSNSDETRSSTGSQPLRDFTKNEHDSPSSSYTAASVASGSNRVPFFRYFGPTAIVPGFKQMVVQVKDHRRSFNSVTGDSPSVFGAPSAAETERPPSVMRFYDATDPSPIPAMITHLCDTFFTHLGCNYPFLQRKRFLRDLEEKRVDAILVDAVCALAARFSSHPLLASPGGHDLPLDEQGEVQRAFRGQPLAQRAMSAVVDSFPCPTMAVAQACLLLAYEEFGTDRDSGLWMYLGTSIRMAQDLGIQKLHGLQLEGRIGPTPKTSKHGAAGIEEEQRREAEQERLRKVAHSRPTTEEVSEEDRRASEQERIDTFYAIFFLDRAVSSGVGRPVTLRDKDIEISFPYRPDDACIDGWPDPFPPLIRIVHLYGRAADVLNNIKEVNQVTPGVMKRLAGMEKDLTGIYQRLSPKLYFNATNFQHYVKAGQGTNFILLHFWFHTLIVMLHQPTLLYSFKGDIQSLFTDSRELSMSSAKTIADILAFAELIDAKSFIGNPFTSQPMYVAACAFLAEAAAHASQPASRAQTPPELTINGLSTAEKAKKIEGHSKSDHHLTAKHTLLATAANQNYQRCYKALKALNSYWAGTRYILTALDQKSKGIMDPLLFTSEDIDSEMPSTELNFTTPGWRRSTSHSASMGSSSTSGPLSRLRMLAESPGTNLWSPKMDPSQAIGWSLTGTTNSPAPNLSFLYQMGHGETDAQQSPSSKDRAQYDATRTPLPGQMAAVASRQATDLDRHVSDPIAQYAGVLQSPQSTRQLPGVMPPPPTRQAPSPMDLASNAETDLFLGLNASYNPNPAQPSTNPLDYYEPSVHPNQAHAPQPPMSNHDYSHVTPDPNQYYIGTPGHSQTGAMPTPYSDMMIESQDIDMMHQQGFAFPGGDMIPWLEYLPQDVLNYFGEPQGDTSMMDQSGTVPGSGLPRPQ